MSLDERKILEVEVFLMEIMNKIIFLTKDQNYNYADNTDGFKC
jgi:hypothetical protein